MHGSLEFTRIVAFTRKLVEEKLERRLPDSEVAAIQCMWDSIDYAEFSGEPEDFMSQYRSCYKSTTKAKAVPTLASGASRILKLYSEQYDLEPLTRTNFRRKITEACEQGVIELEANDSSEGILESETEHRIIGRDRELALLQESVKSKNVILVWGNPGIGKSTLLRYFCENNLLTNSHIYAKYSDFNTLDSLLRFLYSSYISEEDIPDNLVPYMTEFLSERDFQIVVDFDYDIDPDFGHFLESISNKKLSDNSCVICISRKNSFSNYDIDHSSTLIYPLGALSNPSDYYPYLKALGLQDRKSWEMIVTAYEGNFRELKYVAKFIREIFGGSISTYFSLGSLVLSPEAKGYFNSIRFSDIDYEIFELFRDNDACISIEFFKFLKGNISTSQIFSRILFLENHNFLLSKNENGQMTFTISSLLRAYLMEDGKIAA